MSSEGKRYELRQLAEVALEGAGHRPVPCPICDLARAAQDAASEIERLREALEGIAQIEIGHDKLLRPNFETVVKHARDVLHPDEKED